jgi:APA family basic amino acid/polyamine antiporter
MKRIFERVKPIGELIEQAKSEGHDTLKRTLTAPSLVMLGIGAIIGAGLFVNTARAAAEHAGPSVSLAFILAALGCAFAGLCYAELSSSIPIAGSAYTYTYATMGEILAWIIGWDLVLEYAVGAATVGIAWSEYFNNFLVHVMAMNPIPYAWCHSPMESINILNYVPGMDISQLENILTKEMVVNLQGNGSLILPKDIATSMPASISGHMATHHGIMNLPAFLIVSLLSLVLIKGTEESAFINGVIVIAKVAIVILIIGIGWGFMNPANHTPYIPEVTTYVNTHGAKSDFGGFWGIVSAAGVVFFAFIGFDAVSTAAQEAKNPAKSMPIGILGSLLICTILYVLFSHVLTGVATVDDFRTNGKEASIAFAIQKYMVGYGWLAKAVTVAILAGFSSVILVMLMGQSRVFYSMGKDGLLPKIFSDVHPKFKTPYKANLILLVFVGAIAALIPIDIVGEMTSIGTLFAFILVCIGVIVLRKTNPELPRGFRTPLMPFVPIMGIISCGLMMSGLDWTNWLRLAIWLAIGMAIYYLYGRKNSKIGKEE